MKSYHFAQKNRPFHLAQRNLCFEYAQKLLREDPDGVPLDDLIIRLDEILELLTSAEKHAYFMTQVEEALDSDEDLLAIIRLTRRSAKSILAVLHHQKCLRDDGGFIHRFLGTESVSFEFSAHHYHRRFFDLRRGLLFLLHQAENPYKQYLENAILMMPRTEQERYNHAIKSLKQEFSNRYGENTFWEPETIEVVNEEIAVPEPPAKQKTKAKS